MNECGIDADVVVLGAGMAGLTAARSLAANGFRVLVLEAQNRVGGRILTMRVGGEVVELGAEFVHGRPPELLALIEEAGLKLIERSGSFVNYRDGTLIPDEHEDAGDEAADASDPFSLLEQFEDISDSDLSFAEFLDKTGVPEEERDEAVGFVEGFNAADHRLISAVALGLQQKAEDAIDGDRSFHIAAGYDQLPGFLAKKLEEHGGDLRLDTRVDRVKWRRGRVVAHTSQGSFAARRAVIALPLGLLQSGGVEFDLELSEEMRGILVREGPIEMGSALRFTMIFRERFWNEVSPQPEMKELSFVISRESVPPVWWTAHPEASNVLTGWIGGPRTALLTGMSAQALAERGCEALAQIFSLESEYIRGLMTGCYTHDWSADPHSRGAYSYIAKGGMSAPGLLAQPVDDTLFFAGEHTATDGHWGTVHAALVSGLRAARQIGDATKAETNTKPSIYR